MNTPYRLQLERWSGPNGDEQRSFSPRDEDELVAIVRMLHHETTATLFIEHGDDWLVIDTSDSRFSVAVQLDSRAYTMIGDATAIGSVPFVSGGQLVTHPRRYLVAFAQAQHAALIFFRTGMLDSAVAWDIWDPLNPDPIWND